MELKVRIENVKVFTCMGYISLLHGFVCFWLHFVTDMYSFSRSASWIFFSTSAILFAPLLFEIERMQIQTAQLNQQKQVNCIECVFCA